MSAEDRPSDEFREMFQREPDEPIDLDEYWKAPGVRGGEWENKPHRMLFDCLREIHHLRMVRTESIRGLSARREKKA